ncbi:MAG: hypothetical protein J1F69_03790 [Clostridiales bacterium]|nr:hypothetical protein [Clostridiales bacterium]
MVDFSKIINIVFVSACGALSLLFLISLIAVAAKGKRKMKAGDVCLRILSSLVMIASAFMLACSVLTMTTGSVAILVSDKPLAAVFVMGKSVIELPVPDLFFTLSTVIGFGLSAVLFILSLTALIVDCLVANKKDENKKSAKKQKKAPAVQKSPEQLKREAELERIKRIGEAAVRKTNKVASGETAQPAEQKEPASQTEQAAQASAQPEEPVADWRKPAEEKPASFVGIKDEQSDFDNFDNFDSFDEPAQDENAEEPVQDETIEQTADNADIADGAEEVTDNAEDWAEDTDVADEFAQEVIDEVEDEFAQEVIEDGEDEFAEEVLEDGAADEYEEFIEEDGVADESDEEETEEVLEETDTEEQSQDDILYDDDEQYAYSDDESDQAVDETAEDIEAEDNDEYEQPASEDVAEQADVTESQEQSEEQVHIAEPESDYVQSEADEQPTIEQANRQSGDIEPDRGIYIPEIRTVTQRETAPRVNTKPTPAKQPVKKAPAKKPASRPSRTKKSDPAPTIPPEKKLPVRRRYVILDRHNAVNMFGEYLKERNQAEKDKLTSSINTIIIE